MFVMLSVELKMKSTFIVNKVIRYKCIPSQMGRTRGTAEQELREEDQNEEGSTVTAN